MKTSSDYVEVRHPKLQDLSIQKCYLCNEQLAGDLRSDHIIPDSIFKSGSPHRPQLPVHHSCNNKKSREDEWALRQIQIMAALNPDAEDEVVKLLQKANREKPNAFLVGKSNQLRNYKFATSMLDKTFWGLQVKKAGQTLSMLNIGKRNSGRTATYIKTICRGLFIRNVSGADPVIPELQGIQYAKAELDGVYDGFMQGVEGLIRNSSASGFYQSWADRVWYCGSRVSENPNKGFVFIEFYNQVGFLAAFR